MSEIYQYLWCFILIAIASFLKKRIEHERRWDPEDFLIGYEITISAVALLCFSATSTIKQVISDVQKIPISIAYPMLLCKVPFISYLARIAFMASISTNQNLVFDKMKGYYFKWSRWQIVLVTNLFSGALFFSVLVPFAPVYDGGWGTACLIFLPIGGFAFVDKAHVGVIVQTIMIILLRFFLRFDYQTLYFIGFTFLNFSVINHYFEQQKAKRKRIEAEIN